MSNINLFDLILIKNTYNFKQKKTSNNRGLIFLCGE